MHPIFRREVYTIVIVQLFGLFSLVLFGTYFGIQLDNLGASALVIGIVFASRNFIQIFLRVPFSELSQSVGRKPMIITGIFCYSSSLGILYFASHWTIVFAATILVGIGMSLHWPAVFSYIGDISGKEYGRINGIIFQGQDIGIISGTLMATYLLKNGIVGLKGLFGISFIIGTFGALLAVFILPEVLIEQNRVHVDSKIKAGYRSFANTIKSLKKLSGQYPLALIFAFEFLITFTEFFLSSFFPLLVVVSFSHEKGDVSNIIFLSTVITILIKPYFGKIFDKWGYKTPILISLTICSIMFVALTYATTIFQLLIIYTITISAIFICFIASTGATNNTVIPGERGLAMGVLGIYISSGRAFSSIALAPMLGTFEWITGSRAEGIIMLFRFTAILIFLLVIIIAVITRKLSTKHSKLELQETSKLSFNEIEE